MGGSGSGLHPGKKPNASARVAVRIARPSHPRDHPLRLLKERLVLLARRTVALPTRVRATKSQVMLHGTLADIHGSTLLAAHPRAIGRGARVVDEMHWDGLPTGKNRRTTTGDIPIQPRQERPRGEEAGPLQALLNRAAATRIEVGRRPLSVYDELTGTRPFTTHRATKEPS
ncbi:hypothetical protein ABT144_24415 [Streptomyces sp. NPDC002039]|uniref:hypothetical protein n=1 Tax=Streptomyces sp. NPDC002039 TaxID=3154660 RepID=UPI00331E801E